MLSKLSATTLLLAIVSALPHQQGYVERDQTPVFDTYHDPNDYIRPKVHDAPVVVLDAPHKVNVSLFVMSRCPDAVSLASLAKCCSGLVGLAGVRGGRSSGAQSENEHNRQDVKWLDALVTPPPLVFPEAIPRALQAEPGTGDTVDGRPVIIPTSQSPPS